MFIYTLPIIFANTDLVSPAELLLILVALYGVLHLSSPWPDKGWVDQPFSDYSLYRYLFDSWNGQVTLWRVFWPFFLILNGCLVTADSLAKAPIITVSSWDDVHFMLLAPILWWTVAIWRCSENTQFRAWGASGRLMTLAVFSEFALRLLIRRDYPRLFFNCQELLLDYASCF